MARSLRLFLVWALAALALAGTAQAAGGNYVFDGGTPTEQGQVQKALNASAFDWNLVPARITVHIAPGISSEASRGELWFDAGLLDTGVFSWGIVQHEYAHQVDYFLLDDAETITKKIKRAVTDSGAEISFDETRPAIKNLLTIYHLLAGKTQDECVAHFEGKGYGQFKGELAEAVVEFLKPFQDRVKEYDDTSLNVILKAGAEKARGTAADTLNCVYRKVGIV